MRIAYLSFEKPQGTSGVSKKITAQINEWQSRNHDVCHFCLSDGFAFIPNNTARFFFNLSFLKKKLKYFNPDVIYMREMLYVPGLIYFLNIAPYYVEINSDAHNEYKNTSWLKSLYYMITKNKLLSHARGLIYVTHELQNNLNQSKFPESIVVSNGYDLSRVSKTSLSPKNENAVLIYISNPEQSWTNKESLKQIAKSLPNCKFVLIGGNFDVDAPNISNLGFLNSEQIHDELQKADIGIGTLGLYRKKMEEACPLKVREYIAFDLPVILPYKDTDLSEFTDEDGVLSIENQDNSFLSNIERIKKFIETWEHKRISNDSVKKSISLVQKEKKRLEFMEQGIEK